MTARRALACAGVMTAALLGMGACTDGGTAGDAAPTAGPGTTAPPTPAGTSEAAALARLPSGTAGGSAVVDFDGVGELDEAFAGECREDAGTTTIAGTADTAEISVRVGPGGAGISVRDVGLSADGDLATGRYDVDGAHLSLDAPLVSQGQVVGSVRLEVDCGL